MELQILLVSFLLSALVYFVFRHYGNLRPLPPSPLLRLPLIGHMPFLGPLLHQSFQSLSHKYGPIFTLHLGSIVCVVGSSTHYAKLLLQTNEQAFSDRFEPSSVKRLTYDSSMAFAPYNDYWRFIRKVTMNELLGSRNVNNFQHLRLQETRSLLRVFANKAKACEAVSVTDELLKLTNNVISRMILGEAAEAREVVRDVAQIFGEFNVSDFVWLFQKLDLQGFGKRTEVLYQKFDTLVERIICKREQMRKNKPKKDEQSLKDEGEIRDFLDILLDYAEDERSEMKMNRLRIKALILDLFSAGTDTQAISIEWALVELMRQPKLLQQAREEIDNVVGKSRLLEESDCANLPFLQAIVKETFRMHPPVPLVSRKCVADTNIENYVIPKDSLLFVNIWSIGRDPKYWDNALEFRPERFIKHDSSAQMDIRGQYFQLMPFGSGRRMCPGVALAMQEVPGVIGAIIQCFDFQVVDPKGKILKGDDVIFDMNERPGLTAPRAQELVCVPVERSSCKLLI